MGERWLKVLFEGCSVAKMASKFEDAEGLCVNEHCVVLFTAATDDHIRDVVWSHNDGAWCELKEITEVEADKYC